MAERDAWIPWAGAPENYRLSITELVANGTMDAAVAGTLWSAAAENLSFLTVAVPREAGKTTVGSAVLALRKAGAPLHFVVGLPDELQRLREQRLGGYVVVGEFSPARMPSYIWGPPVRDVFATAREGYSLQTSLHAPGVAPALAVITEENRVPAEDAALFRLVVYIEVVGRGVRRVSEVFELTGVENGRLVGQTLFRWSREHDRFDLLAEPSSFGGGPVAVGARRAAVAETVEQGRTSIADVEAMRAAFEA